MFSISTIQRCINCLLLVLIFTIECSAMTLPVSVDFNWNAEEVELIEMSDSAEDKKENTEHDLDKDSTPLVSLANKFSLVSSLDAKQMAADIAIPEMDVIVPPPER